MKYKLYNKVSSMPILFQKVPFLGHVWCHPKSLSFKEETFMDFENNKSQSEGDQSTISKWSCWKWRKVKT